MATKGKKKATTATPAEETKVTRIKAADAQATEKKRTDIKPAKTAAPKTEKNEKKRRNPLVATGDYFKGAWYELKQVRWPNRRATWGMTTAVLAFTAFFVVIILLLDALFKYLFQLILG